MESTMLYIGGGGEAVSPTSSSDWHHLNPVYRTSYPWVPREVQVRFTNGNIEEDDRSCSRRAP
jgi:hypothetical protein